MTTPHTVKGAESALALLARRRRLDGPSFAPTGAGAVTLLAAAICIATGLAAVASAQVSLGAAPGTALTGNRQPVDDRPLITHQIQVQDIARMEGHGTSILRGIGIVTGLRGTGDSGNEEVLARPLAQIYKNSDNPLPDLKALAKSKSSAIVFLEVVIPPQGAQKDDEFPVYVTVSHTASSLAGGRLFIAPLSGPLPGQGVFAIASGAIILEDAQFPTSGVIRKGARMIEDIRMPTPSSVFNLVLQPAYRRYASAQAVASVINSVASGDIFELEHSRGAVAVPIDHASVRITIPASEQGEPARFIARVLSATFSPELLQPPAMVRINQRSGTIIATATVEISPTAIAHRDLQIVTILPDPVPSQQFPKVTSTKWTGLATAGKASERAKLQDLLAAFKQLDVPVDSQISIITELYNTGRLHAELVFE